MEHTEPPLIAAVPTRADPYQRLATSADDSPSTFGAHRKIHVPPCGRPEGRLEVGQPDDDDQHGQHEKAAAVAFPAGHRFRQHTSDRTTTLRVHLTQRPSSIRVGACSAGEPCRPNASDASTIDRPGSRAASRRQVRHSTSWRLANIAGAVVAPVVDRRLGGARFAGPHGFGLQIAHFCLAGRDRACSSATVHGWASASFAGRSARVRIPKKRSDAPAAQAPTAAAAAGGSAKSSGRKRPGILGPGLSYGAPPGGGVKGSHPSHAPRVTTRGGWRSG